VICGTGGVGVMLDNPQISLVSMMMQAVQNVWRLTLGRSDDPRKKWPVSTGHMGVENAAGADAIFRIYVAGTSGPAAGAEVLPI
jgi:hypothetical protein